MPALPLPAWTVTLTYLGYALVLLLCAAAWLAALFDHVVYGRVELGLLDERWRDIAWQVGRQAKPALALAAVCGGLAFLLALPGLFGSPEAGPAAPAAQSHRAYQVKAAGILLCLLLLAWLARGRMGAFDADAAAVVVFAWALWVVAAGWLAQSGGAAVTGPSGWWLALGAVGLSLAAVAVLAFLIWREGGIRMF